MMPQILIMTGARQVGKSTVLDKAISTLRVADVQITGLLTRRTGPHDLAVTELHTGATYTLTDAFKLAASSPTRNFVMSETALTRSRRSLESAFPTQVFVLDELGPLELRARRGWVVAFELLKRKHYGVAIVVVRPELLGEAIGELPGPYFTVINVTRAGRDRLPSRLADWVRCHPSVRSPNLGAVYPTTSPGKSGE